MTQKIKPPNVRHSIVIGASSLGPDILWCHDPSDQTKRSSNQTYLNPLMRHGVVLSATVTMRFSNGKDYMNYDVSVCSLGTSVHCTLEASFFQSGARRPKVYCVQYCGRNNFPVK